MQKFVDLGKVCVIGVLNFIIKCFENLFVVLSIKVILVVNQVEVYFYFQQLDFFNFCKLKGIVVIVYLLFGNNQIGEL